MRRKRKRNGDVIIDLTSLLDVIFIVLLVVICYASSLSSNYLEQEDIASNKIEEAENAKNVYDDMKAEGDSLVDFVGIIVVRIPPKENDYTKRTIYVLENGEDELVEYQLEGNNTSNQFNEFKSYIGKYIEEHDGRPVIISLNDNDEDILYRDEKIVLAMIDELKLEYNNIYSK